jgi:hypothetical protein
VVYSFVHATLPLLQDASFQLSVSNPTSVVNFSFLNEVLVSRSARQAASVQYGHNLDLSLSLPSRLLMPSSCFEESCLPFGSFLSSVLPKMTWDVAALPDDAQTQGHFGRLRESLAERRFQLDLSCVVFSCPVLPRLLSRSLKVSWDVAALPGLDLVTICADESRVDDFSVWTGGTNSLAFTEHCEMVPIPARPFAELAHSDPLPLSSLLQSEYDWHTNPLPTLGPVEQLSVAISDSSMFPGDLECPGVSMVIALPPQLVVDAPLLSARTEMLEVQRCSLVTLELQMSSATLPLLSVNLSADEKAFFRFHHITPVAIETTAAPLAQQNVVPVATLPAAAPVRFSDRLDEMDDDQFIACAKAETQRLIGYQDNGRGDIHHFLAMCAEFASRKALFDVSESTTFVAPKTKAIVVQNDAAQLRPLSKRIRAEDSAAHKAEETKRPKAPQQYPSSFAAPSDMLSSFMKARGVDTKKTWSLQGFPSSDDAASNKVITLFSGGKKTVRLTHASPSKSLLSVCLLAAAKHASKEEGSVVCLHEHLAVAQQHLAQHAAVFSGVSFGDRIKPKSVAFVRELPPTVPANCLVVVVGSDAFVRLNSKSDSLQLLATIGPCDPPAQFDVVMEAVSRVDYRTVALQHDLRALANAAESRVVDELNKFMINPPARLLSAGAIRRVMEGSTEVEMQSALLRALIAKNVADILGSHSVARAHRFLQSCFEHPIYGELASSEFAELAASLSFGEHCHHVKSVELEQMLHDVEGSVLVLASDLEMRNLGPNAKVVAAGTALQDSLFQWSSFGWVVVVDNAGGWEAAEAIEQMRIKAPNCKVSWILTDYEMTRSGAHLFWSTAPSVVQIVSAFDLSFEWKMFLSINADQEDEVPVVASRELLVSSPNLMSSLSSSLGVDLVLRAGMAADLIIDESRCVLVRTLHGISFEELCTAA